MKPAHADVATSAGWPSGAGGPLGTPVLPNDIQGHQRRSVLKLRVTATERADILGRVPSGRVFSEWARCILTTGSGEDTVSLRRELVRQIAAQGNNLNQLARAMNQCALSGNAVSGLAIATELRRIREVLEGLLP
jgi:hypothetical protein